VRELQNVIERAVILCPQAQIPASLLSLQTGTGAGVAASAAALQIGADITLEALERRHVEAVLARASTLDEAARSLGIDSSTLYRKRKTYGLD
jgi:NtrC-family two-component system response regulator AlgB